MNARCATPQQLEHARMLQIDAALGGRHTPQPYAAFSYGQGFEPPR